MKTQAGNMITLTKRQQEVLELVAQGLQSKEIAARLRVNPRTVEAHKGRLLAKSGAGSAIGMLRAFYDFVPRTDTSIDG